MKVLCYATYLGEHIYVDKWHTTWKAAICKISWSLQISCVSVISAFWGTWIWSAQILAVHIWWCLLVIFSFDMTVVFANFCCATVVWVIGQLGDMTGQCKFVLFNFSAAECSNVWHQTVVCAGPLSQIYLKSSAGLGKNTAEISASRVFLRLNFG